MKQPKSNILIYLLSIFISSLHAQEQQVNTLLSTYGLGVSFSEATITERAQGEFSVVNNNDEEVTSITNPALLGDLKLTALSVSLNALGNKVTTQNSTYNTSVLSIANLSVGFPIGKKGGFVVGLRPHTAVGYEVEGDNFYHFSSGGVNQAYASFGYELFKGFSLGAQISQFFGKTEKRQAFDGVQNTTVYDVDYNVNGNALKIGGQYKYTFSKVLEARIGVVGVFANEINATGTSRFYEAVEVEENTYEELEDTSQSNQISGVQANPFKSIFGLGIGNVNQWFAGISYETQKAIRYTGQVFDQTNNNTLVPATFEPASKISLGGYFIPKKYALKGYYNRIVYRAGLKYQQTGLVLKDNSVNNIGISFGLGLPVGRRVSYLNLSLELGKLGDVDKNSYQEEYVNVGINFSLSDKWFNKRVID